MIDAWLRLTEAHLRDEMRQYGFLRHRTDETIRKQHVTLKLVALKLEKVEAGQRPTEVRAFWHLNGKRIARAKLVETLSAME